MATKKKTFMNSLINSAMKIFVFDWIGLELNRLKENYSMDITGKQEQIKYFFFLGGGG
jgi:hypothetical protein